MIAYRCARRGRAAEMRAARMRQEHTDALRKRILAGKIGRIEDVVRHIVLHLSACDLARARLVSKTWKSEVENWQQWREWLFQAPVSKREYLIWEQEEGDLDKWHASLETNHEDADLPFDDNLFSLIIELHPVLADHPGAPLHEPCMPWLMSAPGDREYFAEMDTTDWVPGYLTQPPLTYITISWGPVFDQGPCEEDNFRPTYVEPLQNDFGIHIQDVLEAIRTGPVLPSIPYDQRFATHQLRSFCSRLEPGEASAPERPLTIVEYTEAFGPPIADSFIIEFPSCILRHPYVVTAVMKSADKTATWCRDRSYTLVSKDPLVYEAKE